MKMGFQGYNYESEIRNLNAYGLKSLQYYAKENRDKLGKMAQLFKNWKFVTFGLNIYSFLMSYFHIEVDQFLEEPNQQALDNFVHLCRENSVEGEEMEGLYKIHALLINSLYKLWENQSSPRF